MPIVDIKVMKGALSEEKKLELVQKVGEIVLAVEGEAMRRYLMVGVTELTPPCVVAGRTIPAGK